MLLSIIIPVYNTEPFLRKCIDSLLVQKCDLEIILVDDGSIDLSPKICDDYASKYKNIIVLHQLNQGVSIARKNGLTLATGVYVTFVDSDDYIDENMYSILLKCIGNADIALCGVNLINSDGKIIQRRSQKNQTYVGMKECNLFFLTKGNNTLFDKIYKKSLFDNVIFPKFSFSEDYCVLAQIFLKANKIVNISNILYFYVQHNNSACHQIFSEKKLDCIKAGEFVLNFYKKNNKYFIPYAIKYLCNFLSILYRDVILIDGRSMYLKIFYRKFCRYYKFLDITKCSFYLNLKFLFFRFFPLLYNFLILKKGNQ